MIRMISTIDAINKYDISNAVHDIVHTSSILSQPDKLTFILEDVAKINDNYGFNEIIKLGATIKFYNDEIPIFKGIVFKISRDSTGAFQVVAYSPARYLQNHMDYEVYEKGKHRVYMVFDDVCKYLGIPYRSNMALHNKMFQQYNTPKILLDKSGYEIIKTCCEEIESQYKWLYKIPVSSVGGSITVNCSPIFFIKDTFGSLELKDVLEEFEKNTNPYILGKDSYLIDWAYDVDVDTDTYNEIFVRYNETDAQGNKIYNTKIKQASTIKEWGNLRKYVVMNGNTTEAEVSNYMQTVLSATNRAKRSMKLTAIGVDGLVAGESFYLDIDSGMNIQNACYIISATHRYSDGIHTMELQVNTHDLMPD